MGPGCRQEARELRGQHQQRTCPPAPPSPRTPTSLGGLSRTPKSALLTQAAGHTGACRHTWPPGWEWEWEAGAASPRLHSKDGGGFARF